MELTTEILWKTEWIELPKPGVRMKFRRDSTGFYEREGAISTQLTRDNYLYRLEGTVLHLKFSHAREWLQVGIKLEEGHALPGERFAERQITLDHDPYAWHFEERKTPPLRLASDAGAALLG
jgi:hypothetical protein